MQGASLLVRARKTAAVELHQPAMTMVTPASEYLTPAELIPFPQIE